MRRLAPSRVVILASSIWCLLALTPSNAAAQKVDSTIAIGYSTMIWSASLQEQRRLLVALPPHYEQSGKAYPVLYLLDAEAQFTHVTGMLQYLGTYNERIPEMIVVGITNSDRSRDLTPETADAEVLKELPTAGHADAFLEFLADELIPWVETRYRTVPFRILVGHSFGGLFCTYAIGLRPDAFQAHIAISPSLWWNKGKAVVRAEENVRRSTAPPWLFLSWADDEPTIQQSTQRLVAALSTKPPAGLRWTYRYYAGEDHMSTPHRSLYDALGWLYSGWRLPVYRNGKEIEPELSEIERHQSVLSQRYGYPIEAPLPALIGAAQTLAKHGKSEASLELLRRAQRQYPYLADAHRALGDALEKQGRRDEAMSAYQEALQCAVNGENPDVDPVTEFRDLKRKVGRTSLPAAHPDP